MAGDGLDELEEQANKRRRRAPKPPRNPKPKETPEARAERLRREQEERDEARRRREREEEERRQREEEEGERQDAIPDSPAGEVPPDDVPSEEPARTRPKSIPFYYNEENEEFLWEIAQEAAARREKIPASAVLRLAMRRLQDQMTPARIVQELGGPSPVTGKRGRPRR